MRLNTKKKLIEAINYCENRQKSVEFTIQYMQDYADVDLDCVMKFLKQYANKNEILKSYIIKNVYALIKKIGDISSNDLIEYEINEFAEVVVKYFYTEKI